MNFTIRVIDKRLFSVKRSWTPSNREAPVSLKKKKTRDKDRATIARSPISR